MKFNIKGGGGFYINTGNIYSSYNNYWNLTNDKKNFSLIFNILFPISYKF